MLASQAIELFYLFFQGVLIFQAAVFAVVYFISFKKDVLFYSLFLLCTAAYFFINAPYTFFGVPENTVWESLWYDYINTPVLIIANIFYILFLQSFFTDLTNNKGVNMMFRLLLLFMYGMLTLFAVFLLFKISRQFFYYSAKLIIVLPAAIVAFFIVKENLRFSRLVATGCPPPHHGFLLLHHPACPLSQTLLLFRD